MHLWKSLAVAVAALAAASGTALADTYTVNPSHDVQFWIDQSQEGDTFHFLPGTYNQALEIPHSLTLRGQGPKASIVLDGSGLDGASISVVSSDITVTVRGMTLRFGGDSSSVESLNSSGSLKIENCVFRGASFTAVTSDVDEFTASRNVFRGCNSDIGNQSEWSDYIGNRHLQTLRLGVFNGGPGSMNRGRFEGVDGTCVVFASSGFFFFGPPLVGSGSVVDIVKTNVYRSSNGLFIAGTGNIDNCRVQGASGQAMGVAGYDSTITNNTLIRFGVGINVFGEYNSAMNNTLRDGTVGIFLVMNPNSAEDNRIMRTTVGIRMGERYGRPFAEQTDGGGFGGRVRIGFADSYISRNELTDILGIGIALDSASYVEIDGNILSEVGGRSLDSILKPLAAHSNQSLHAGAITVYNSDSVAVHSNSVGDVDAGAGVAVHRTSYSTVSQNTVATTTGNGIGFGYGDPFTASGEYRGYYYGGEGGEYEYEGPLNLGRGLYSRMNIFGPMFNNIPEAPPYLGYFFYEYFIYFGSPSTIEGGYYYADGGKFNYAHDNVVSDAALRYGAGISAYEQYSTSVTQNYVTGSGSTGILIDESDYCVVASNSVLSSEADGIWIRDALFDGGNVVDGNTVSNSGAEGIQNDAGYVYSGYCTAYDGYGSCIEYGGEFVGSATVIRNNTVVVSGIADFANSGDIDVGASTGNSPQPADWYDIPVRQY